VRRERELVVVPAISVEEKLRFWCPVCGMCADLERLDNSPYEVDLKLQRFGGYSHIEYVDVDEEQKLLLLDRLMKLTKDLPQILYMQYQDLRGKL